MQGAERVEQAPDGAEEEGGRDESDPEKDVDGAGSGVVRGVVGTEEEVEEDGQCGGEAESAQGGAGGRRVGGPLEGGGEGEPRTVSAESGGGPEQAEGEEGDEQRGEGTGEGVEGRDRQIVLGPDPVREQGERIGRVKDHALADATNARAGEVALPDGAHHRPAGGVVPPRADPGRPGVPDSGPSPGSRTKRARWRSGRTGPPPVATGAGAGLRSWPWPKWARGPAPWAGRAGLLPCRPWWPCRPDRGGEAGGGFIGRGAGSGRGRTRGSRLRRGPCGRPSGSGWPPVLGAGRVPCRSRGRAGCPRGRW